MRKVAVAAENATACKARIASLKRDKDSLKYFTIPGLRHNIGLEQLCTKEGAPRVPVSSGTQARVGRPGVVALSFPSHSSRGV